MGRMPEEVLTHELNMLWQDVFTWASWGIAILMLIIAWRMGVKQRTPFYFIACVAVAVGAYVEPLYDVAFDLWFYDVHNGEAGAMYSHFTAFGIPQPYWTHSGYMILYATACLYAGKMIFEGRMTPKLLFIIWGAEIAASCAFEVIGTGMQVYTYYGPYVMRIWNYPLVIGVLEGTQVILFTVLAVNFWRLVSHRHPAALLGLFVLFPVTMMGANTGVGAPIVIALHLEESAYSSAFIWAGTFMTYALCALSVYGATLFLPKTALGQVASRTHRESAASVSGVAAASA